MCCPEEADSGFLCNIKKIFTGMKRCQSPCKEKVYTYSMSQLKSIQKEICILEEETYVHESTMAAAMSCESVADFEYLRCAMNSIMDKLECIRCDLQCAHQCYDPVRDRCENELISEMMDRTRFLEVLISDLLQRLCLLEWQGNCWSGGCGKRCKQGCSSPCGPPCGPSPCGPRPCGPSPCGPPCGPSLCGPRPCGPSPCGPPCGPRPCGPCGPSPCGPRPCGPPPCGPPPCGPRPCGPSGCRPCGPAYPMCNVEYRKPRCKPGCRKPCCYNPRPTCSPGCTKPCCRPVYRTDRYYDRYYRDPL